MPLGRPPRQHGIDAVILEPHGFAASDLSSIHAAQATLAENGVGLPLDPASPR